MLTINKMRANITVDFAAEELKKYLRMMMPDAGDVQILYDPQAIDGFRLGLFEDFGMTCEAEDPTFDDVVHIETTIDGGILAGSNPRSVLFAVYRLLKENGCRWLYPGVDGEHIPMQDIKPVSYHKMADHRTRGHCDEGAESQQCMLESIDFYAKQELNSINIEFFDPFVYYRRYYNHNHNEENRPAEPVSHQQTVQWKRMREAEIAKRGLFFSDVGHGWTAEPIGLDSSDGWIPPKAIEITEEQRQYLAMIDGKRELFMNSPLKTNLCMSNPVVQEKVASAFVEYAANHQNVDCLNFSLADSCHSHCECPECRKGTPSQFMVEILNKIDEEMTERGIDMKVGFGAYHDTLVPPENVRIKNPKRFCFSFAPITRTYTKSFTEDCVIPDELPPYVLNKFKSPDSVEVNYGYFKKWQEVLPTHYSGFEYHFWIHQCNDPGLMYIARRAYEDILSLRVMNIHGYIVDGSQRSFFPHSFHMHIYAEALLNRDCDYEAVKEDYFKHIYGEDWKTVVDLMERITEVFDFAYMEGEKSADPDKGAYYNPEHAKKLAAVKVLAAEEREIAAAHMTMPTRPQTVSYRMLLAHADYIELLADVIEQKALGNEDKAKELFEVFKKEAGKLEFQWERYYDHFLAGKNVDAIINTVGKQLE